VLRAFGYWKGEYHDLRMFSALRETRTTRAAPSTVE